MYARGVTQRRYTSLIGLSTGIEQELQDLACLCSCGCRDASLWLDTIPMSAHLQVIDAKFASAMRHRLGLTHTPANAPAVQCRHGEDLAVIFYGCHLDRTTPELAAAIYCLIPSLIGGSYTVHPR